ncbi:aspartyl/asparaginyl beta-hydroxylase domain-containing protein [Methylohalobius crimeensis]|uniref:aspartyl/asparaginyl beta-hydroxylase domain-containing protein n=1 Tax=Methylohalobius crimeensis TaxID=244365 RepID=UPI0003B67D1E|nr:aspartyl/asparaginyl beta-hydroxylase domain-containing protein [Methylohalobius crimeensis]
MNLERIKQLKRRAIIKTGKALTRTVDRFLASQSLIGDAPAFEADQFDWVPSLEKNYAPIQKEAEKLLQERDLIPAFHEISPDQTRISKGDHWKTHILYGFGRRIEQNCERCPETAKVLESIPGLMTAWFSMIDPGYHIPPHRGPTKSFTVCHLGLIVPKEKDQCYLRVADRKLTWEEGKCFVFDDTFDHEVRNDTDEHRVVLLVHVERPLRWQGKIVSRLMLALIKASPYVKDGVKNMQRWEDRYAAALRRMENQPVSQDG